MGITSRQTPPAGVWLDLVSAFQFCEAAQRPARARHVHRVSMQNLSLRPL